MAKFTCRQYVELFHLLFLAQLGRKLDKKTFALKGGCNLRFFFKSIRYSDDIDLDVADIPVHALKETVGGILASNQFTEVLQVKGMRIEHVTEHKQTRTTQRWKLGLHVPGVEAVVPTKIEFSRRGMGDDTKFESIDPTLIRFYELTPFMQKLEALVTRSTPQARDVFDLHLLLAQGVDVGRSGKGPAEKLQAAKEKVLAMSFNEYKSQVVACLTPEDQPLYDSEELWDTIRLETVEWLGRGPS